MPLPDYSCTNSAGFVGIWPRYEQYLSRVALQLLRPTHQKREREAHTLAFLALERINSCQPVESEGNVLDNEVPFLSPHEHVPVV